MSFLGAKKRLGDEELNVSEIELEHGVSAGILLRSFSESTIPPYYEHLARLKLGKTLDEWQALGRWDKAMAVATMQVENAIHNHQAEAEIKQAQRNTGKK
jgi:hypothetical protein